MVDIFNPMGYVGPCVISPFYPPLSSLFSSLLVSCPYYTTTPLCQILWLLTVTSPLLFYFIFLFFYSKFLVLQIFLKSISWNTMAVLNTPKFINLFKPVFSKHNQKHGVAVFFKKIQIFFMFVHVKYIKVVFPCFFFIFYVNKSEKIKRNISI